MKVSVASKKQKVLHIIAAIFVWAMAIWLVVRYYDALFAEGLVFTIFLLALVAAITTMTCITLFSRVVIDENGITLKRGV